MPTSTVPSSAASTDFTIPRSVMGRWISGSETVARAAWMASSAGAVMSASEYVLRGRLRGEACAALHERENSLLQQNRLDRFAEIVVGPGGARLVLDPLSCRAAEEHERQR